MRHLTLRLHDAAVRLPKLEPEVYRMLREQIAPKDGPLHLTTPIVVSRDGLIVDGRHRARILVESGRGKELVSQIEARAGDWVEQLPEGVNPYVYVAKLQRGRRNCPAWRIAWAALPEYEQAVEEGNRLRGKSRSVKGAQSPVDAFCSATGISKAVFNEALKVRRSAEPGDIAALEAGRVSLNAIVRKLDAEKKRQARCGSEGPQGEDTSIDGHSAKSRKRRSSSNAASEGGRDLEAERKLISKRLNHLLRGHADETAAAIAQALLASLDDPAKQLIIDAVHGATATQPKRGVVPNAGHSDPA